MNRELKARMMMLSVCFSVTTNKGQQHNHCLTLVCVGEQNEAMTVNKNIWE